ncbi:MAG TPA: hypothetical protein VGK15_00250 [Candidatus Limnocylindria bacterium]
MQESLGEPGRPNAVTRSERRRAALRAILGPRAESILDRVVVETLRATDFVGLGRTVAQRYTTVARACLPFCLAALGAGDIERTRLFDENAHIVKDLVELGVPRFVQRSLISLGFRVASGIARDNARAQGFEPDELENELRVFQRAFEARLFFGV